MPRTPRARTSQHHAPRPALAALLAAATLIVGCGPSARGPEVQATPTIAEQWFAARASAQRQGAENLVAFYDPVVVLDHRALGPAPIHGRAEALEYLNAQWQPFQDTRTKTGPMYLSTDAALTTETVASGRQSKQLEAVVHTTMGSAAAVAETIAASLVSWRTHDPSGDERTGTVQALAQHYAQAWSQEDVESVLALYRPDAVVTDSLAGVTARGAAQIADLVDAPAPAGGLGKTVVDQLPDYRGPAVFAAGRPLEDVPFDTVALLMTVGADGSCPHRAATVLQLGRDGLIRVEERLHRIDDLRRCQGALPPGWWDSMQVPDPVLVERTGTLLIGDLDIEVYNGTPGLEGLITWSFDQFRTHGLGTPTVRRVTFHDNQIDKCEGVTGLILGDAVTICFDSDAACKDQGCTTWDAWVTKATLHELAHAWMDEHLTPEVIEQFQTATSMPTWSDPEHPWGQRGVELAAETIAWAMVDQPIQVNPKLGPRTCDELARYYEILTGSPPEPTPPGCEPTPTG
jgi:hypothetical protein